MKIADMNLQWKRSVGASFGIAGIIAMALISSTLFAENATNVFEFLKFYETKQGPNAWTSEHWANGHA